MNHSQRSFVALVACAGLSFLLASPTQAAVEDFSGPPAGTVVAGTQPGGGSAPGTLYPNMRISVTNNGGGPNSLIVFDSSNPTGGDGDLGTPNNTFAGPGVGVGGQSGQPGQNDTALGNLLIIAEDIVDATVVDGLVDDPDDEAGGGTMVFDFDMAYLVPRLVLVDIDEMAVQVTLKNGGAVVGMTSSSNLGDNSVQTIPLAAFGPVNRIELVLTGSGAIAELEFNRVPVPVEATTWSGIKSGF